MRGETPEVLERDQEQLAAAFREGGKSSWRHTEIVRALKRDAKDKCMYCESFIDDVSYGAVEHIWPKSRFEHLALEWSNLGYCCPRCNTNKGAYWSAEEELRVLDPYTDDIESYLMIVGPLVLPRRGSTRGSLTLAKLKFKDNPSLIMGRMRAIQALEDLIVLWEGESRPAHKQFKAELIDDACGPHVEYTAVLRAYATYRGYSISV